MIVRDSSSTLIHITFDALVTIAQGLAITVEEVDIPRDDGNSTSPVQPVVCTISPSTSWNNIGQHSVGLLFVTMVGQPFFVNGNSIKVIKCCLNGKMTVTSPTVLLALRGNRWGSPSDWKGKSDWQHGAACLSVGSKIPSYLLPAHHCA